MIHPRVVPIIAQVVETFGADNVTATESGDGCVWVAAGGIDLGPGWAPPVTTLSVKLAATFPDSAPYPWYLPAGTARVDGVPVDRLTGPIELDGATRLQLSLNGPWGPDSSLADRMLGVVRWLRRAGEAGRVAS